MKFRSLFAGFLMSAIGSAFCMGGPSHEDMMTFLMQAPEQEAKELIYGQFDADVQRANESLSNASRGIMIEAALGWLVCQYESSWKRNSALAFVVLAGLSDLVNVGVRSLDLARILSARETFWKRILGMRQQLAAHYEEMLHEREILEPSTQEDA